MRRVHSLRWSPDRTGGLHNAQVFVAGKWRTHHVACRRPRVLKRKELLALQRFVWLNTGKIGKPEDIEFEIA